MAVYTTINDGSAYFQTALYTGNGGTQVITNDGNSDLQPDWVWTKGRSNADNNSLFDSSRGTTKEISTNGTGAEGTASGVTAFSSDGFTLGSNSGINGNTKTYVAWQWKANGGTTSSNSDGSLASTVQANTTAGFSIVTYTGTGSSATVGHGLGAVPHLIIVKRRDASDSWRVYHKDLGLNGSYPNFLQLDQSAAEASGDTGNFTAAPSSTVFSVGNYGVVNANNATYVAYAFIEKQGYSKFGKYTGNGSTDGAFIYTGFKPAWLMTKNIQNAANWRIWDNRRTPYNANDENLIANSSLAENSSYAVDFLSNGWKARVNDEVNNSGNNFIYLAFAEYPFVSSAGVPTTAR